MIRAKFKVPEVYVCEPIPEALFPDLIPVLDMAGGFLFWADETQARKLVSAQQVRICRTKKKIRALQATCAAAKIVTFESGRRAALFGLPHRRETEENPAHVWTQDKMGSSSMKHGDNKRAVWSRKACKAVVTSCLKEAA